MPSSRKVRSRSDRALLLEAAQAGGGLVQDDHDRIGRERARDFQQALLTERQIAGEVAELFAESDALQLLQRLGLCGALLGAVEAERAGEKPRSRARICSEQDIVEQRHVRAQFHVLERARNALGGDMTRRQARHVVVEEQDLPGVRFRRPGDQIEQRGLAGAVRADQAQDLAGLDLEAHVIDGS